MTKKLIVNADGFGFTPGVNKGILETIINGIVTSTSCVVNFPYIKDILILRNFDTISIGIHFNLSVGKPILSSSKIPSLVNENGEFWGDDFSKRLLIGRIKYSDIKNELEAQVKVLLDFNIRISHWDGHQNRHLYPQFFFAALEVAQKYNILRMRTHRRYLFLLNSKMRHYRVFKYYLYNPHRFLSHLYSRSLMLLASYRGFKMADRLITPAYIDESKKFYSKTWLSLVENLPEGINEIYCHPGYPDEILKRYAKYVFEREEEIKILTSKELKDSIRSKNIELISFNDL